MNAILCNVTSRHSLAALCLPPSAFFVVRKKKDTLVRQSTFQQQQVSASPFLPLDKFKKA
jgi:hypothetical protein